MERPILDLGGRVALITGAGQGIGRQVALHFARHNAGGIVVNDFVAERAEAVAREVTALGVRAMGMRADVTDYAAVQEMVAAAAQILGPIGVLVNNAGNFGANPPADIRRPFWETGPETWNPVVDVNLNAVMNCVSAVVPGMIAAGKPARLITIISEAGRNGDAGLEVYGAAKAGAAGFMRGVAKSLGRYGITANSISIAATVTPATADRLKDAETVKRLFSGYIIRRPGQPEEIANMVLFLASDASAWITGQTYPVNGGFTQSL